MNRQALRQTILEQIQAPAIPDAARTAADFGIRPDVPEPQTALLQAAIDELSAQGGGRLIKLLNW